MKRKRDKVRKISKAKKKTNVGNDHFEDQPYQTKDWDYIIHHDKWFAGKVNVSSTDMVISNLCGNLSNDQRALFRKTCFGPYVDMKEISLQPQLIHQVLLREVKQPNLDEMWFKIGEKCVRFSIHEFCLITGLRCMGNDDLLKYQSRPIRIKDTYFRHLPDITRSKVKEVFVNMKDANDQDVVRIGVLYLITSFLFTTSYKKLVDDSLMALVDSDEMETFAWGKELYRITLSSLKSALRNKSLTVKGGKKASEAYRLNGFPLVFQLWIYETIPSLEGKFCTKVNALHPRILNWRSKGRVTSSKLNENVFDIMRLEVNVVEPNDDEKEKAYMVGLIDKGRRVLDSDFEDPKVRASKPSHSHRVSKELSTHTNSSTKAAKCKENERCFNEEIINRLADIQSKQHQLASDQVELKLEMIGLRRFVANTFADLMGEIKNKNSGKFPKPSDLQMVVYTGEVESERKVD